MAVTIVLRIGQGNFEQDGFPVSLQIRISSNLNVASEMLRGVAQAQDEINKNDGAKLEIKTANDRNDEGTARQIATEFVNDNNILAVVGHNASNVSKAAADIYQNKGLVMITPAGFADILSGFGSYIFRTVPNPQPMAHRLASYIINTAKKTNIAVCYDSEATDNNSFKESFVESLRKLGGEMSRWSAILLCQRLMRMRRSPKQPETKQTD